MIYLVTALYCEAQPFIRHFHMGKNLANTRFQEFYQEAGDIRLLVTGVGEIAAAAAVGSMCTEYKPQEGDMLLNIGICAHTAGGKGVFLCNKITEQATGKTFYPDILYRHDFCEDAIVSGMLPWNGERESDGLSAAFHANLYDMEAAAVYQAGSYFFGPHQMLFLKVVSDGGNAREVSREKAACIMEAHEGELCDFIHKLPAMAWEGWQSCRKPQGSQPAARQSAMHLRHMGCLAQNSQQPHSKLVYAAELLTQNHSQQPHSKFVCAAGLLTQNHNKQEDKGSGQEILVERLSADLHCSKVMEDSLRQHIRYLTLAGIDYVPVIQDMYREGLLPCEDKRKGKLCLEELKRRLF